MDHMYRIYAQIPPPSISFQDPKHTNVVCTITLTGGREKTSSSQCMCTQLGYVLYSWPILPRSKVRGSVPQSNDSIEYQCPASLLLIL